MFECLNNQGLKRFQRRMLESSKRVGIMGRYSAISYRLAFKESFRRTIKRIQAELV